MNSKQNKTNNPYAIFDTPEGMTNDAMSGWRTQASAMNNKYKMNEGDAYGDILNYGTSDAFKKLDVNAQNQYYTDLANYNALANTIAGYDADYLREAEEAKRAADYANNRRSLIEKYMPETLAAMGYANTGLAGDALLKMNNAYDNYIIQAQDKAARNQMDLMSTYREKAMEIESGINAEKQEVLKAKQDLYNDYLTKIYKGEGLDASGVAAAVKLGALTPEQAQELRDTSSAWNANGEWYVTGTEYSGNGGKRIDLKLSSGDKDIKHISTEMTAAQAMSIMKDNGTEVNNDGRHRQSTFLTDVLSESANWSSDMNGTLVDFNYGWTKKDNEAGSIYVFYDGDWYLTNLSRNQADDEGWTFLSAGYRDIEGKDSGPSKITGIRGTNFYWLKKRMEAQRKANSNTESK